VQIFAESGAVLHRFGKNWQIQPATTAPLSAVKLSASAKHVE